MAQPPMPPNKPLIKFADPWAIHSRFPEPRVSVKSSTKFKVIKLSINPTAANKNAVLITVPQCPCMVSKRVKMFHWNCGKPPFSPSPPPSLMKDPTVLTSILNPMAMAATTMIPVNAAGTTLVTLGNNHMMAMVNPTSPIMVYSSVPSIQTFWPFTLWVNMPNWLKKITMAKPLTNPIITGWGMRRTNFPRRNNPATIWMAPTKSRVMNNQESPSISMPMPSPTLFPCWIKCTITTAMAPVAPEIIPGRPPKSEVISPIMKAPYRPTSGGMPATKAKATASGTSAKATVKPDRMSFFGLPTKLLKSRFMERSVVLQRAKVRPLK